MRLSYFLRSVTFRRQLQDTIDVLSAVRSTDDYIPFLLHCHYRAFRKIGSRVLDFYRYWGKTPFQILRQHLPAELTGGPYDFHVADTGLHLKISREVKGSYNMKDRVYTLDSTNAPQWVDFFSSQLSKLSCSLVTGTKVRKDLPSRANVEEIVGVFTKLDTLYPLLQDLFLSSPKIAMALSNSRE